MTEGYEFGGAQFVRTESEWAQRAVVNALDHEEVLGHTAFRCARSVILNQYNEWWAIKFEHMYEVHPFFVQLSSNRPKSEPSISGTGSTI